MNGILPEILHHFFLRYTDNRTPQMFISGEQKPSFSIP